MWYRMLFPSQKREQQRVPFLTKASRMKASNLTKSSFVLRPALKPD